MKKEATNTNDVSPGKYLLLLQTLANVIVIKKEANMGSIIFTYLTLHSVLLFCDLNHWHSACQRLLVEWLSFMLFEQECCTTKPIVLVHNCAGTFCTTTTHFSSTVCCHHAASLYWLAEQFPSILWLLLA